MWKSPFRGWKSLKNLKVVVFETDFNQVQFVFWQTTCTYSESWGALENLCDPLPPGGSGRGWGKNDRKSRKHLKNGRKARDPARQLVCEDIDELNYILNIYDIYDFLRFGLTIAIDKM